MKRYVLIIIIYFVFVCNIFPQPYRNGAVSSAHKLATETGIEIMKRGGNAIDAAVGMGFVLSVVYPQAGNIGGGGFMVIRLSDGITTAIDFRETAPDKSFPDMYLDSNGFVIDGLSTFGHLSCAVPGSPAGLIYALEKYGTMKLEEVISYSIDIAENGFPLDSELYELLIEHKSEFNSFRAGNSTFGRSDIAPGKIFKQPELAETLRLIKQYGRDGFYKGITAERICSEMKYRNGLISENDLANYKVTERTAIRGTFKDYEIISMPLPSSGGICLIYMLNVLEKYLTENIFYNTAEYNHLLIETFRRVYADRSEFLGDPDFISQNPAFLISKKYAEERFRNFNPELASLSSNIKPGNVNTKEGENTTHYSVADKFGNCVSVTTTLNDNFGSKLTVEGTGFLLNNEMDDFSVKPGVPNMFGLTGSEANEIRPGKRPLSSMTPTIILKNNKPALIVGSPGGSRIITSVLQVVLNIFVNGIKYSDAIDFPRLHHQWLPDVVYSEKNYFSKDVKMVLTKMGHDLKEMKTIGRIDAVYVNDFGFYPHSDRRGYGYALGY